MDHPRKVEHQGTGYQSLGTDASLQEAKGEPGGKNDQENKGHSDLEQPTMQGAARIQHFQGDTDLNMICRAFSRLRLHELDRVFQRSQFPNVFVRKEPGAQASDESEAESVKRRGPEDEVSKKSF